MPGDKENFSDTIDVGILYTTSEGCVFQHTICSLGSVGRLYQTPTIATRYLAVISVPPSTTIETHLLGADPNTYHG